MRWGPFLDRFWRRPPRREARNEQKKALAAIFNALAITTLATGLVGPSINPVLEASLSFSDRLTLVASGVTAHIVARAILWSLEDR